MFSIIFLLFALYYCFISVISWLICMLSFVDSWQLLISEAHNTIIPPYLPASLSRLATGIITWHLYFVFCLIIWQISWKIWLNSRCRFELFLHLHKLINSNDVFIINYYMRNSRKTSKWLSYTLSLYIILFTPSTY